MKPHDELLEAIAKIGIEMSGSTDGRADCRITLLTGGMLISGRIVSCREFCLHHFLTAKMWDVSAESAVSEEAEHNGSQFIHLKGARFFHPATKVPLLEKGYGVYWRARLDAVDGFTFGELCGIHEAEEGDELVTSED